MCTTMIITPGATADGSMMVTHSDDNELSDQRLIYVPAQDHAAGGERGIIDGSSTAYPRLVSTARGPGYELPGWPSTPLIGNIAQVAHTFAYFDGSYGIMNEHNLMMGECTNGARYQPACVSQIEAGQSGKHCRLFYSAELSRIALERCRTARDAVKLMGALIDEYGYFSTGETLLVGDAHEAWVFEMCALPDEQYHSAWIAQRVPDGTVFVAANEFRIRTVLTDSPDQIFSGHLLAGLEKVGYIARGATAVDWLRAVSEGEYAHPYYSLRRVWRIFDRVNPDLGLSPWVSDGYTTAYPFSIAPRAKLVRADVIALYRDHYEGTQFDLTRGTAAGPYGDPNRFIGPYDGAQNNVSTEKLYGAWERAISIFYQGYTYVAQTRPAAPVLTRGVLWFGADVAYTTCFVPFPAKVLQLPQAYQVGDPQKFSRSAAWWAFDFVANWARLNFQRMCRVDIQPLQHDLESRQGELLATWDQRFSEGGSAADLTALCDENANAVLVRWWTLGDSLVARYSDGYINLPAQVPAPFAIGYPSDWLGLCDYRNGPVSYDMKL
jgi:dipeptidase